MKQPDSRLGERSLKFVKNYKRVFDETDEPTYKIAEMFDVDGSYSYKLVEKFVAPALGVPYETLIRHPKSFYRRENNGKREARASVNTEELRKNVNLAIDEIEKIKKSVDSKMERIRKGELA